MGPLRGKGSESQDRLIFKEEFIMYDIITKGGLTTTENENREVCLLGKLEWHLNYEDKRELGIVKHSHVTIVFNNLECIKTMEMFKSIKELSRDTFECNKKFYLINENGIRIHVSEDTLFRHFQKAIRHLFGFAISEMAENGVSVKINISTDK